MSVLSDDQLAAVITLVRAAGDREVAAHLVVAIDHYLTRELRPRGRHIPAALLEVREVCFQVVSGHSRPTSRPLAANPPERLAEHGHVGDVGDAPELLTYEEAARLMNCSPRTVRRRINDGQLETHRPDGGRPRVRHSSVVEYLASQELT